MREDNPSESTEQTLLEGPSLVFFVAALFISAFIEGLDFSIANVAIPSISADFGTSNHEGTWVITLFAVSCVVGIGLTPWAISKFGSVRLIIFSNAAFTLFSFLCGFAWSFDTLLIFRILQGAFSGPLIILPQTMVFEFVPERYRHSSLSFVLVGMVIAPILGPLVGGLITDLYGWRWIFYINIPFGIISTVGFIYILRKYISTIRKAPLDVFGVVLLIISMFAFQIFLDRGNQADWFSSTGITSLAIVTIVSLTLFIGWSKYSDNQLLAIGFFRDKNYTISLLALSSAMLMINGTLILVPLYVQSQLGYTPYLAGMVLMPFGILPIFIAPIVAIVMKKMDLRILVTLGFLIFSYSSFMASGLTIEATMWDLIIPRLIQGAGIGFVVQPLQQLALAHVAHFDVTKAMGLITFTRLLIGGGGVGTAVYITFWERRERIHHSDLTEVMTPLREVTLQTYDVMHDLGANDPTIATYLDYVVTNQSYTIAFNEILWISGCFMLVVIPFIWLCKLPAADRPQIQLME